MKFISRLFSVSLVAKTSQSVVAKQSQFVNELAMIYTGKNLHQRILDNYKILAWGEQAPLSYVSKVSVDSTSQITLQVFDRTFAPQVEYVLKQGGHEVTRDYEIVTVKVKPEEGAQQKIQALKTKYLQDLKSEVDQARARIANSKDKQRLEENLNAILKSAEQEISDAVEEHKY